VNWPALARRVRVPLGFVFAILYLWLARPSGRSLLLGGAVVVAGLWLRAVAAGYVRKSVEITTTGPYAYTRNPLYLGSLIIAVGFALASRSPWIAGLIAGLFLLIYYPVIHWEEKYLRANFPEFSEYSAAVPRLLPKWRPGVAAGAFSRKLYLKHREYNALLGAAAMLAALVIKLLWFQA